MCQSFAGYSITVTGETTSLCLSEYHKIKAKCSDCTLIVEYERRFSDKNVVKNDAINGVGLRVSERDNQIPRIVAGSEIVVR
jgi:hypothetical protein